MSSERKQLLREIATEALDVDGQRAVEERLGTGKIPSAEVYLLGALDRLVHNRKIDEVKVRELYIRLNVDPGRASRIMRQANNPF